MPSTFCLRIGLCCLAVAVGLAAPASVLAQPVEPQADDTRADPIPPAAPPPPGYFLLPVPGGQAVFERLGFRAEERSHALVLFARSLHGAAISNPTGSLAIAFTEVFGPVTQPVAPGINPPTSGGSPIVVLAPFSDRIWRRLLLLDEKADLFAAIVKHRGALLVAAGAMEVGPEVRNWLAGEPRLLQDIVRQWPGSFTQAAPALERTTSGWAVPGDPAAWSVLVGVPPTRVDEFLRRLLAKDEGRLARFFGTLGTLEESRRTALLQPLAGEDGAAALASVYEAAKEAEAPWSPNLHPYQLSYADLPSVLHALVDLEPDRLPPAAGHWPDLLTSTVGSREDAAALLARQGANTPYAATVRALLRGSPRERRDHIAMLAIARRVWDATASASAQADLVYAIGHYRRYRGLLLMLDRIGVRDPAVFARLVDAARRLDGGGDRTLRLSLFQGALALVERTSLVDAIDLAQREDVLRRMAAEMDGPAAVHTAVRRWLLEHFIPALPPLTRPDRFSGATAYESRVLQALAGPPATDRPRLSWEGMEYVVDPAAAEHERIVRIRSQLPSPGLDAALAGDDAQAIAAALRAMIYAVALGDPEGPVTLSPDVVDRHDVLGTRSAGREFAWAPAVERSGSGSPWHIAGSLLGLDLALARSSLRRMSADDMPPVPSINLNDELTLARTAVALQPQHFDERTHREVAAAIARGRARVREAGTDPQQLLALASEVAVPRVVLSTFAWTLASTPTAPATLFSLRDLMWLGHPDVGPETLARWGVMGDAVDGRLLTRFDRPVAWDRLAGRPDTGVLATQVPDLCLRLAEVTAERGVPASLIPALLLYATQDYWHEVEARFSDDWPALVRAAAALPASRIEDYIAALASGGPLRPR